MRFYGLEANDIRLVIGRTMQHSLEDIRTCGRCRFLDPVGWTDPSTARPISPRSTAMASGRRFSGI